MYDSNPLQFLSLFQRGLMGYRGVLYDKVHGLIILKKRQYNKNYTLIDIKLWYIFFLFFFCSQAMPYM